VFSSSASFEVSYGSKSSSKSSSYSSSDSSSDSSYSDLLSILLSSFWGLDVNTIALYLLSLLYGLSYLLAGIIY